MQQFHKKKITLFFFVSFLFWGFLFNLQAQSPAKQSQISPKKENPGKNLLWKIQGKKGIVYLLGSLHFGKSDFYPLDAAIEEAYQNSEQFVLEVITDSPKSQKQVQQFIGKYGVYPSGQNLSNQLSPFTYARLASYLIQKGEDVNSMNQMKPWVINLILSVRELSSNGLNPNYGIDQYFYGRAVKEKKKILELETIAIQLNFIQTLFGNFPSEQEETLLSSLDEFTIIKKQVQDLTRLWQAGDEEALYQKIYEESAKYPKLFQRLEAGMKQRNHGMIAKIEEYLQKGGNYFVVAGAGHYGGREGILDLLKKKKYRVERVAKKKLTTKTIPISMPEVTKKLSSQDQSLEIMVPKQWTDQVRMLSSAKIQAVDPISQISLLVIQENKKDLPSMTLEKYVGVIKQQTQGGLENAMLSPSEAVIQVDGKKGLQYAMRGESQGKNLVYLITAIEGAQAFYRVLLWVNQYRVIQDEKILDEFKAITKSFRSKESKYPQALQPQAPLVMPVLSKKFQAESIEIQVPQNWQQLEPSTPNSILRALDPSQGFYLIVLRSKKSDLPLPGMNLDDYYLLRTGEMRETLKSAEFLLKQSVQLKGVPARQGEVIGETNGVQLKHLNTVVEGDQDFYNILLWSKKSQYKNGVELFKKITETFKGW